MRGDKVYRVYGVPEARHVDWYFGAYRTAQEAQAQVERLKMRQSWANQYHNGGFVVREATVNTDFEIPSRPKPRDRYVAKGTAKPNRPGFWDSTIVEVFRRSPSPGSIEPLCQYERNYGDLLRTFEPFRQGDREFALISRDYTRTSVLDLASGKVIAEEAQEDPRAEGFCPVGFYVPDWWDLHDGSVIPGSESWNGDHEWPTGEFGFVWGCYWGDDTSWKVQYLDLSRIQDGTIIREERFGYVELATSGFSNPCLSFDSPVSEGSASPPFIHMSRYHGKTHVTFAVEMRFELESGKPTEWQRLIIADYE
jgi:hypothetical protein